MKTYNTEFDEIIITFTNQNGRPLEMGRCSIEPRTKKDIKRDGFLTFVKNIAKKYRKQLLDKGLDALKTVSKKKVIKLWKILHLNIILHLDHVLQKLTVHQ